MAPTRIAKCVALGCLAVAAGAPAVAPCGEGDSEACAAGDALSMLQVRSAEEKEGGRRASVDFDAVIREAVGHLAKELGQKPALIDGGKVRTCDYEDGTKCPLSSMTAGVVTKVFPGGGTECLDGDGYFFQVQPGDPEKLLYYFQGGGACWTEQTYQGHACTQSAGLEHASGILNMADDRNPYKGWSKVVVSYCSGDIHTGNTTQVWGGSPVKQVGYLNALSVYDYAITNFPKLTSLVFAGCSAGSLGMQFWSHKLADSFNLVGSKPVFFADSFMGAFYPPTDGQYLQTTKLLTDTWNLCTTGLLPDALQENCTTGRMVTNDPYLNTMQEFPNTDFNIINSKADDTQVYFGKAITATLQNTEGATMTPAEYYQAVNVMLKEYNDNKDYSAFLVDGTQHCYTNTAYVYSASVLGKDTAKPGAPKMIDWMSQFTAKRAKTGVSAKRRQLGASMPRSRTVCSGDPKDVTVSDGPDTATYCDDDLV